MVDYKIFTLHFCDKTFQYFDVSLLWTYDVKTRFDHFANGKIIIFYYLQECKNDFADHNRMFIFAKYIPILFITESLYSQNLIQKIFVIHFCDILCTAMNVSQWYLIYPLHFYGLVAVFEKALQAFYQEVCLCYP